ncbi:MAG: EF-hand domain-containing protein [Planctomycetota bacterium]|nr:EF-hand domain-containing protein [Planctomycetota bacterium]MDA1140183.1 EF-hand domain-containing protein [Planctomycetota bacterium]
MNSLHHLGKLILVGSFLMGTSLFAQDRPADGEEAVKPHRPSKEEILQKFDKDGDGELSEDEKAAMKEAMEKHRGKPGEGDRRISEEMRKKFDADGDGKLNEDERAALKEAMKKRLHADAIKKFDKDGDGELNEEERAAAREAGKNRRGGRDDAGKGDREGGKGRHNFDDLPEKVKARLTEKFDADGDGKLNDEEKAKAKEEMQKRREGRKEGGKGDRPAGDAAGKDTL